MEKQGRAYPNPEPKHPISARLEHVRGRFGYQSKRAFWQALTEDGEYQVSYEAVRNYHYDREPPPSYLAQVADRFGVRLEWLVRERGEVTEAEEAAVRATSIGALPGPLDLPLDSHATNALLAAWGGLVEAHGGELGEIVEGTSWTLSGYAWGKLQGAVAQPLETLREFLGPSTPEAFNDYVATVALAIRRCAQATKTIGGADAEEA